MENPNRTDEASASESTLPDLPPLGSSVEEFFSHANKLVKALYTTIGGVKGTPSLHPAYMAALGATVQLMTATDARNQTQRLTRATWVLAVATAVLAFATVGLVAATIWH